MLKSLAIIITTLLSVGALADENGNGNPCKNSGDIYTPFSLVPLASIPDLSELLKPIGGGNVLSPGSERNGPLLSFDLCTGYDQNGQPLVTLSRLIYRFRTGRFGPLTEKVMNIELKEPGNEITGMTEAAFGDVSLLKIVYHGEQDDGFYVQGFMVDGQPVVIAAPSMVRNGERIRLSGPWMVGALEMGDPLSANCSNRLGIQEFKYAIGPTMKIAMKACVQNIGVSSKVYDVRSVTWANPDSQLPASSQGPVTLTGDQLKGVFEYRSTHHNCDDTMTLKVPFGTYFRVWNSSEKKIKDKMVLPDGTVEFEQEEPWQPEHPC